MEYYVKNILKIGLNAISFSDKQSCKNLTPYPVILSKYFTIKT